MTAPEPSALVKYASSLWTVSTDNEKTGRIPTKYVGATVEETRASCDGCSLAPWANGGCYAWNGNVQRGANSVRKAAARGKAVDLPTVLERTPRGARAARWGAIGDPARCDPQETREEIATVRGIGLKVLGYTHHWRELRRNSWMRSEFLASCETMEQVEEARERGWLVAIAGPGAAVGYLTCPHYAKPWITCNTCGACDVPTLRKTKYAGIVFPAHGGGRKRLPMATATATAKEAR